MNADALDKKPSDKLIPWMIVLFFVVLATLDMIFVTVAIRTQTGVVFERAYEEGLHYNKTLKAAAQQNALGWQNEFDFKDGIVRVGLTTPSGTAISGATIRAAFSRPVKAGYDFEVPMTETTKNRYETKPNFPLPGQWNVRIYAEWQGQPYQFSRMITAP